MRIVLILSSMAVVIAACGGDDGGDSAAGDRHEVVASFQPLAEAAERVGGDVVAVRNITPPGVEPHDVELDVRDVDAVLDADLVVTLGGDFQPAVDEVAAERDGATLVVLEGLTLPDGPAADPHVWLDPRVMAAIVEEVGVALTDVEPAAADAIADRAADFVTEIESLDGRLADSLADCERDLIVASHEAYGWLAARYGLRQEGVAGLAPDAEPDPRRLDELVRLVQAEGVTTVFTERLASAEVAETLAREAGVTTAVLDPLEGPSDGEEAASYIEVMDENREALAAALGCR